MMYINLRMGYVWECTQCDFKGDGNDITDAQNHVNNEQHVVKVTQTNEYQVTPWDSHPSLP